MNEDQVFEHLFSLSSKNGLQYLYSLLRVKGIESYLKDPLVVFKDKVSKDKADRALIEATEDFWGLLANLSRVSGDEPYRPYIFWAKESENYMEEAKKLVHLSLKAYLDTLFPRGEKSVTPEQIRFIKKFFDHYESTLKFFKSQYPFAKMAGFEVLEILTSTKGLIGFRVHFSNGSNAEFKRNKTGTMSINLMIDPTGSINFMAGNLDEMKPEWRVGNKLLYEIGLPDRYNIVGEWMPLIYPGESGQWQTKALGLTEEERIQGVLFYIYCTCHWAIEFAAKLAVKLPEDYTKLPGNVHLHRVKQGDDQRDFYNEYVYDGTMFLDGISVEEIQKGLDTIQRAVEGIAFAFDCQVKWQVKYKIMDHQPGVGLPNKKDMTLLQKLIKKSQEVQDITIDTAINWYKLGLLTDNKLNAFLCFHIAIEGLAVKLANGELEASKFFNLKKENKEERKKRMKETFDEYYKLYYTTDLKKLINDAYFDCLQPITASMKRAFAAVFGKDHPVIKEYFEGKNSLNSIRGQLAHGEYSDWHYSQYLEVWKKLHHIQEISKGFITRVILQIPPGTKRPTWQRSFRLSVSMDNPKGSLIASRLDVFPTKDWKIKPEWID